MAKRKSPVAEKYIERSKVEVEAVIADLGVKTARGVHIELKLVVPYDEESLGKLANMVGLGDPKGNGLVLVEFAAEKYVVPVDESQPLLDDDAPEVAGDA